MTTEEKLRHLQEAAMKDARSEADSIVHDYEDALTKLFEEHKDDKIRQAKLTLQTESDNLRHEMNKAMSKEQLKIRRRLSRVQTEYKDRLFEEVRERLAEYRKTPDYDRLLEEQIREAVGFARKLSMIIYLDPEDEAKKETLEKAAGVPLTLSKYSFGGGIRAVVEEKNILIDRSFDTKLSEAYDAFTFDGGTPHE